MDMTKAFDLLQHSVLFKKLLKTRIPPIFLRLLIVMYLEQQANVKWMDSYSDTFPLSNGVRQGGVISAILYCFYGNELFRSLRNSGLGCWINDNYHGIFGYSDDNLLLAPSTYALQKMVEKAESFAYEHGLKFSTNADPIKCKTKCTAFTKRPTPLADIKLCGNVLPWVDEFKHLGNTISNKANMTEKDIYIKRAQFISKAAELNQEFYFASGRTRLELNSIYNNHFTGSSLWNLFGKAAKNLECSYNVAVRNMFGLPLQTHRNLIEVITKRKHLMTVLYVRFLSFIQQIQRSPKVAPKMLLNLVLNDVRSTTGNNIRNILLLTNKDTVNQVVRSDIMKLQYHPLPEDLQWKDVLLSELLEHHEDTLHTPHFSHDEIGLMVHDLCVN